MYSLLLCILCYMQYIINHGYTLSIRHEHTTWYQYIHMYLCRWHLSTGCHFSFFYVGPLKNDNILENSKFLTKSIDVLNAKKYTCINNLYFCRYFSFQSWSRNKSYKLENLSSNYYKNSNITISVSKSLFCGWAYCFWKSVSILSTRNGW